MTVVSTGSHLKIAPLMSPFSLSLGGSTYGITGSQSAVYLSHIGAVELRREHVPRSTLRMSFLPDMMKYPLSIRTARLMVEFLGGEENDWLAH